MLHRIKKQVDVNKDKWIGVGGHFEEGESPEECLLREVKEETGLELTSYRFRGLVTFLSDGWEPEYMCLYTADGFKGELSSCDEGTLEWIPKDHVLDLNLWEGDRIFFRLLNERTSFFSLKLQYKGDGLVNAALDGQPLELFDVLTPDGLPAGFTRERTLVHRYGDPHATSHVWVARKNQMKNWELLLQKRSASKDSFPGCYDISSAGHVPAGSDYLATAIRELSEELGICASPDELRFVGKHRRQRKEHFDGRIFRDCELSNVYIYDKEVDITALSLQREEVESVRWMEITEIKQRITDGTLKNCLCLDEIEMVEKNLIFPRNLFLIGFMGTGKSTVAAKLGAILNRTILEMDETIEREQNMSISDIFSQYGEPVFRDLETQLLIRTQKRQDLVVSCGGGVALRSKNVAEMKKNGVIILLTATPETILQRVQKNDSRPLLRERKTVEGIAQLMDARKVAYQAAADITVATDNKSASEIAKEILALLKDKNLFTTC